MVGLFGYTIYSQIINVKIILHILYRMQKYIKRLILYDQVGFIPEMQMTFIALKKLLI